MQMPKIIAKILFIIFLSYLKLLFINWFGSVLTAHRNTRRKTSSAGKSAIFTCSIFAFSTVK